MNASMIKFFAGLVDKAVDQKDLFFAQSVLNLYYSIETGGIDNITLGFIEVGDVNEDSVKEKLRELKVKIPSYDKHYDNRVTELKVENFRTFPKSTPPYGLVLGEGGKPCSVFLVGANGTGKSVLYDALQQYYTGHVSKMSELALSGNKSFLHYMFNPGVEPEVKIETVDGYKKGELGDDALSFFISDTDLNNVQQFSDNLSEIVLEQLGYSLLKSIGDALMPLEENEQAELTNLQRIPLDDVTLMKRIIRMVLNDPDKQGMLDESKKFSTFESIKDAVDNEDNNHKYFKSLWNALNHNRTVQKSDRKPSIVNEAINSISPTSNTKDNDTKSLASAYRVLHDYLVSFSKDSDKAKKDLNELLKILEPYESEGNLSGLRKEQELKIQTLENIIKAFHDKKTDTIKLYYNNSKTFVEETMNKISLSFQDEFHMDIDEDNGDLFIRIDNKRSGVQDIRPIDYLNTFRFRMYEISIKLSLAFLKMEALDRAVPIVIDDVFNSNDFANGLSLDRFVYRIYETYKESVGFNEPLQIILLTHDELVQSAFKKGAYAVSYKDLMKKAFSSDKDIPVKASSDNVICGRLFPYYSIGNRPVGEQSSLCCLYIPN